jgi:tetratricopeptide (TPR) repeat protein
MVHVDAAKIKKLSEKPWFYPVALFVIGFITYCYVLPSLGYYWDDWEIVMFNELNPSLKFDFYAHDRPFPWTYQLIHSLVGSHPAGWHVVTFLIRWAGVLIFVQALILLWPRYQEHLYWLGALILLYPGFLQQSQSATKARHIMTFLLFALSIYWMVLAVRRRKYARLLFPLSWLAAFAHLFTTEYFSGMELVRPVILWMLLAGEHEPRSQTLRRIALLWLPYLLITAFYFWCRIIYFPVIFQTTSRIGEISTFVDGFQESPAGSFLALLNLALLDFIYLIFQVWINAVIEFEGFNFQSRVAWFAFGVGIVLTLLFAFFYGTREKETADTSSPASIFVLGFISFFLGAIPIWAIGKDISSGGWSDRFALAPLLGACLMVLALLLWSIRAALQKFVLGFLLVFSIAAQIWVVNAYRRDWQTQLDFYWQLYWRAPALQTGTAVFSFEQPSPTVTHYAAAGYALNVLYHYETEDGTLPYWYFPRRFHFDYQPDDSFRYQLRVFEFEGNTSRGIGIVHQEANSCLRVLDDVYALDPLIADGRNVLLNVSDPSRILPDDSAPPPDPEIFGPEPEWDWCYYFQKGDLARQIQNWEAAIDLYKEARHNGLQPRYGVEYLPFIEAYARTGNWQEAYELTRAAHKTNSGMRRILCDHWSRLSQLPSAEAGVVDQANEFLSCSG